MRKEPSTSGVPRRRTTIAISDQRAGIGAPMLPSRRDRGTHSNLSHCPLRSTGIPKRPPRWAGLAAAARLAAGPNGSAENQSAAPPALGAPTTGQGAQTGQAREVRGTQMGRPLPTLVGRQQPVGVNRPLEARQEGGPRRCGQQLGVVPRVEQVRPDPAPQGQIGGTASPCSRLCHCRLSSFDPMWGWARRVPGSGRPLARDACRQVRAESGGLVIPTEDHRCWHAADPNGRLVCTILCNVRGV